MRKTISTPVFISVICFFFYPLVFAYNETSLIYDHATLNNHTSPWNDFNLLSTYHFDSINHLNVELDSKSHFGESGVVAGATYTRDYNEDWYQSFGGSVSTNSKILAKNSIFTQINRKLTSERKLVLGLGVGHTNGEPPYEDWFGNTEAIFYFIPNLVAQTGIRFNQSQPGAVNTVRYSIAFTYSLLENLELLYRYETGKEGYTVLSANQYSNVIQSSDHVLHLKFFPSEHYGLMGGMEYYKNPSYDCTHYVVGVTARY